MTERRISTNSSLPMYAAQVQVARYERRRVAAAVVLLLAALLLAGCETPREDGPVRRPGIWQGWGG